MVELKDPAAIDAMREAGRVVAQALEAVRAEAGVGVTLKELDDVAATVIGDAGATSPFLNYQPSFASSPFPAVICASVNDAIVHGIPDEYRLRDGDLVSIDCGAVVDGWAGDAAVSFTVGPARPEDAELIRVTQQALDAGIAAACAGGRMGDIASAVGTIGRGAGYGIPHDFGGHGVGHQMHEDPSVPNEGRARRGLKLREGLVIAIEPMFMAGGDDAYVLAEDGWALHTVDGTRAAHIEHTIAVTADGPRILTLP